MYIGKNICIYYITKINLVHEKYIRIVIPSGVRRPIILLRYIYVYSSGLLGPCGRTRNTMAVRFIKYF